MQILCEKDYRKFKPFAGNRDVKTDDNRVLKIAVSMEKHGFIPSYHITVNSKFEIQDGQHRFAAAQLAKVPVYYVVDDTLTLEMVQQTGYLSRQWSWEDYLSSHIKMGNENYARIRAAIAGKQIKGTSAWVVICRAAGVSDGTSNEFREGRFIFTAEAANRFEELYSALKVIFDCNPQLWRAKSAIQGAMVLILHPKFSIERMGQKLSYQATRVRKCASSYEYTEMLLDIYNNKSLSHNRISIR